MYVDMMFAGKNASELGIHVRTHRQLRAAMDQNMLKIPGRDGMISQGDTTYQMGQHLVDCIVNQDSLPALRAHIRQVAAWLSKTGRLSFSDEPDKYYVGRIYDAMVLEQLLTHGQWSIVFTVQPFAYGEQKRKSATGSPNVNIPIDYQGTAKSPCRIVIQNTGPTDISLVRIIQTIRTGGEF